MLRRVMFFVHEIDLGTLHDTPAWITPLPGSQQSFLQDHQIAKHFGGVLSNSSRGSLGMTRFMHQSGKTIFY
jgi:hypothetical protein